MASTNDDKVRLVEQESSEKAPFIEESNVPAEVETPDLAQAGDDGLIVADPARDLDQMEPTDEPLQGVDLDEGLVSAVEGVAEVEDLDVFKSVGPDFGAGVSGEASDPFDDGDAAQGETALPGADGEPLDVQVDYESGLYGDPAPRVEIGGSDAGGVADPILFGSPGAVEQEADREGEVTPTDPRVEGKEGEDIPERGPDLPHGTGPPPVGPPPPPPPDDDGAGEKPPDSGESYPVDVEFGAGEFGPIDFSPPDELINPPEPIIAGFDGLADTGTTVGDGIVDPRTINPDPSGSAPSDGGEGDGDTDPGVVDPLGPEFATDGSSLIAEPIEPFSEPHDPGGVLDPLTGGPTQPGSDGFGVQSEDENDLDSFEGFVE